MRLFPFYAPEDNDQEAPRSFSSEEVEALIEARLTSERESFENTLSVEKAAREQAESALRSHEMREMAQSVLRERNLPVELMHMLNLTSEETLTQSLAAAEAAFRTALEEGVRARLCGAPPSAVPIEKPQKQKPLSYQQAADLYKSDRAAYDKRYGGM